MSDWISVGERMPPTGEFVLIHFRDGTCEVARWIGGGWLSSDDLDFSYGAGDADVTHWMPLPESPVRRSGEP